VLCTSWSCFSSEFFSASDYFLSFFSLLLNCCKNVWSKTQYFNPWEVRLSFNEKPSALLRNHWIQIRFGSGYGSVSGTPGSDTRLPTLPVRVNGGSGKSKRKAGKGQVFIINPHRKPAYLSPKFTPRVILVSLFCCRVAQYNFYRRFRFHEFSFAGWDPYGGEQRGEPSQGQGEGGPARAQQRLVLPVQYGLLSGTSWSSTMFNFFSSTWTSIRWKLGPQSLVLPVQHGLLSGKSWGSTVSNFTSSTLTTVR